MAQAMKQLQSTVRPVCGLSFSMASVVRATSANCLEWSTCLKKSIVSVNKLHFLSLGPSLALCNSERTLQMCCTSSGTILLIMTRLLRKTRAKCHLKLDKITSMGL